MANIRAVGKKGKIFSYRFTAYLGRDANGKQMLGEDILWNRQHLSICQREWVWMMAALILSLLLMR